MYVILCDKRTHPRGEAFRAENYNYYYIRITRVVPDTDIVITIITWMCSVKIYV